MGPLGSFCRRHASICFRIIEPAASQIEYFEGSTLDDTMNGTNICSGACTQVTSVQSGKPSQTFYVKMSVISDVLTLHVHQDNACARVGSTYTPTSTAESDKIKAGNLGIVEWAMPNEDKTEQFNLKVTGGCYAARCPTTTIAPAVDASTAAGSVQSVLAFALLGVAFSI